MMGKRKFGNLFMAGRFQSTAHATLTHLTALILLLAAPVGVGAETAQAQRVQRVVSPGGIEAWLIESHTVPIIQMSLSFRGGASQDPEAKPGVACFADWMLNEGVGELNTAEYFRAKKLLGAVETKRVTHERQFISFAMLTENRDASLELLRKMLIAPRFDDDAMARGRADIANSLEALRRNPGDNIYQELMEVLYTDHPYGKQTCGRVTSVKSITRQDIEDYRRTAFARDNLNIAVVGDIDAATLAVQLEKVFSGLPAHARLRPFPEARSFPSTEKKISDEVRQTKVAFGYVIDTPITKEDTPAVQILNHVLSGGILTSRLDREIRVKRGLVYGIGFQIYQTPDSPYGYGTFGAEPSSAQEAYTLALEIIRELAENGPTPEEVRSAKSYLKGNYLVGLSNSSSLALELIELQRFGYAPDAIDTYADRVDAVTLDQLRKVASKIFKPDAMSRAIVGPFEENGATGVPKEAVRK
jgi:zinc protease